MRDKICPAIANKYCIIQTRCVMYTTTVVQKRVMYSIVVCRHVISYTYGVDL